MKLSIYFILSALLMGSWACQSANGHEVAGVEGKQVIKGKIKFPQKDAYVRLSRITADESVPLDSVKADKDGNFKFEIDLTQPTFYAISFYDLQTNEFILSNSGIEIEADGDKQEGAFKTKGSKDTDNLYEFVAFRNKVQATADSMKTAFMSTEDETVQAKIQEDFNGFSAKLSTEAKQLATKFDNSVAAIFPASMLDFETEIDFVVNLADKLTKSYPNSDWVKDFDKNVQSAKKTAVGQAAPEIELETPEGTKLALSSLKGKYVLIDFWASWCRPCRMENPNVVKVYQKYKDKGFEILGVSLDADKDKWLKAISDDGLTWKHISDLKQWQSSVVPLYGIEGIPMTVLLDKDGKILAKNLRGEALEQKLASLFN